MCAASVVAIVIVVLRSRASDTDRRFRNERATICQCDNADESVGNCARGDARCTASPLLELQPRGSPAPPSFNRYQSDRYVSHRERSPRRRYPRDCHVNATNSVTIPRCYSIVGYTPPRNFLRFLIELAASESVCLRDKLESNWASCREAEPA